MKNNLKIYLTFFMALSLFSPASFASEFVHDFGFTLSSYQYVEPDVMDVTGAGVGVDYVGTLMFDSGWFMRGNIISVYANGNYDSPISGTMDNVSSWYADMRAFLGVKFRSISPYAGFGYRYLYYDSSYMITSRRHVGYRRESTYLYIPIGVEHQMNLGDRSKLVTNIEFDYFLSGKQKSYVGSDTGILDRDIIHKQDNGYGVRFSCMYKLNDLFIGPYVNYWHIDNSDLVHAYNYKEEKFLPYVEPENYTLEVGIKVSYRF